MGLCEKLQEATPINSLGHNIRDSGAASSSRQAINIDVFSSTNELEAGRDARPKDSCCTNRTCCSTRARRIAVFLSIAVILVPVVWILVVHFMPTRTSSKHRIEGSEETTEEGDDGEPPRMAASPEALASLAAARRLRNFSVTEPPGFRKGKETPTMKQYVDAAFGESTPGGFWVADEGYIWRKENGDVVVKNLLTGKFTTLVPSKIFRDLHIEEYDPSPDLQKVLLLSEVQPLYRHSKTAKYHLYDVTTGTITFLTPKVDVHEHLQAAYWAPTSDGVAFVHAGDIYYLRTSGPVDDLVRLTRSNDPARVTNGIPDWVYEEEVLKQDKAMWFDDRGKKLAYLRFDDTEVPDMFFSRYGPPENLYPEIIGYKYPKPGTPNPKVTVHVVDDVTNPRTATSLLVPPPEVEGNDYIISSAAWQPKSTRFIVTWLNRPQNVTVFTTCGAPIKTAGLATSNEDDNFTKRARSLLDDKNSNKSSPTWMCNVIHIDTIVGGWASPLKSPWFNHDGTEFLQILLADQGSGQGRYHHIVKFLPQFNNDQSVPTVVTTGLINVNEIVSWKAGSNEIFFLATPRNQPATVYLYKAGNFREDTSSKQGATEPECVSCDWKNSRDAPCLRSGAEFSQNATYFIFRCESRFQPPEYYLVATSGLKRLKMITNNTQVFREFSNLALPFQLDFSVPVCNKGDTAEVRLLVPPGIDLSGQAKYPLIVSVYGAPDYQSITEVYSGLDWPIYLTTTQEFIHAVIDGRGSSSKNKEFSFQLWHGLGTLEVDDQVTVVDHLLNTLDFIDKKRVGIWGWSYGGFVAALALTRNNTVFNCGVSVAPVTNWLYYDSIYTERYMGFPNEYPEAYQDSDVTAIAFRFRGKQFYLIHGNADDNVHYQQSMMLSKALEKEDVLFRQQSYPDEAHDLHGVSQHFYHSMLKFWHDCFRY